MTNLWIKCVGVALYFSDILSAPVDSVLYPVAYTILFFTNEVFFITNLHMIHHPIIFVLSKIAKVLKMDKLVARFGNFSKKWKNKMKKACKIEERCKLIPLFDLKEEETRKIAKQY